MKVTLPSLTHTHTHTVAPTLLPGNESLAFILISENDDARGVIQFTSSEINTTEPSQSFVLLRRTAGTFGEVRTCDSNSGSFNISVQILLSLHILQVHSIFPLCSIPFCQSVPFHFATQFHSILFLFPLLFCSHSIPGICAVGGCTHHCEHIGLCPPRGCYHLPPRSHQHHPPPNHHRRFPPRVFREPYSEVDTSKCQWGG